MNINNIRFQTLKNKFQYEKDSGNGGGAGLFDGAANPLNVDPSELTTK